MNITYDTFEEKIEDENHLVAIARLENIAEEFDGAKLLDITEKQVRELISCAKEACYGSIQLVMGGWGTEIEGDKVPYVAYVKFQTFILSLHQDHRGIEFGIGESPSTLTEHIHAWHRDNLENLDHDAPADSYDDESDD